MKGSLSCEGFQLFVALPPSGPFLLVLHPPLNLFHMNLIYIFFFFFPLPPSETAEGEPSHAPMRKGE